MKEFNISINLTYSKIIATLIFIGAFVMDFANDRSGTVFMFALPFVVFLITGKQYLDTKKGE
jgi:hypothetical protein